MKGEIMREGNQQPSTAVSAGPPCSLAMTITIDERSARAITGLLGQMSIADYSRLSHSDDHQEALESLYNELYERLPWLGPRRR